MNSRTITKVQVISYQVVPDPIMGDYMEQSHPEEADTWAVYLVTQDGDRHTVSDHNLLVNAQVMAQDLSASLGVPLEIVGK